MPVDIETEEYILEVKNLKTYFNTDRGVVKAVDDVSFKLKKGETVGIVGESGSGKSVTSLSLMRLIQNPPGYIAGGEMLFNSPTLGKVDINKLSRSDMRLIRGKDISMIFQEPMTALNPVFTCGNQVLEAILLHQEVSIKEGKAIALDFFRKVQLPRAEAIYNSYPHQISGGQKQRVMIAMAMCCNPAVLIADEPTTALDVTVQSTILGLLRKLRDQNQMSMVFITHDLGVIAEIADRIIVMYHGKIVEQGTVWDIFANPQHPYTKGLLACRPRLDIKMKVLPVVSDFMVTDEKGELTEKKSKYNSVGEAILLNVETEDEIRRKRTELMSHKPILQIKNLQTYFPMSSGIFSRSKEFVKAVDNVSFDVYEGETLGLVGESGCGKTTLGRSILRLVEPTAGEIIFDGRNIREIGRKELRDLRKDMQIIFQDPYSSLNPRMTIGEAILEPMRIHKVLQDNRTRKDRVIELLEIVNLKGEHFNRYPHEFSGGQRQRICIARALALNPRFVICDESVSALDVSVQAQVLNLLNKLKEQFKFTYIFISHDLSVVKFISDRIIVMSHGKIEEIGLPEDIYNNPQTEYTKKLISAIPRGDLDDIRKNMLKRKNDKVLNALKFS